MAADTAWVRIARPAAEVFDFVADPDKLSLWSFGTWAVQIDASGLIRGTSIRDGSVIFVRIDPDRERLLVDYRIGSDPEDLAPRIFIRIAEGTVLGGGNGECLLTMTALRPDGMDDARWQDLTIAHAFEVRLIKSALETGHDHRRAGG